jgi:hypothetical protein
MRTVQRWVFDVRLLNGNSGGPVYYSYVNRRFKEQLHFGVGQGVLGLVIQDVRSLLPEFINRDLEYGVVVPAQFIRETLDLWPGPRVKFKLMSFAGNSENSKANRIETMKGPAESGQICSVGRRKIAKKIAKNKRCYANTLRPCSSRPGEAGSRRTSCEEGRL